MVDWQKRTQSADTSAPQATPSSTADPALEKATQEMIGIVVLRMMDDQIVRFRKRAAKPHPPEHAAILQEILAAIQAFRGEFGTPTLSRIVILI